MSWDAELVVPLGPVLVGTFVRRDGSTTESYTPKGVVYEVNYTHNTSPMIYLALVASGTVILDDDGDLETWWKVLHGLTGAHAAMYLATILRAFDAVPDVFRAMNPSNGWGDFDSLRGVLATMRAWSLAVPQGVWQASG